MLTTSDTKSTFHEVCHERGIVGIQESLRNCRDLEESDAGRREEDITTSEWQSQRHKVGLPAICDPAITLKCNQRRALQLQMRRGRRRRRNSLSVIVQNSWVRVDTKEQREVSGWECWTPLYVNVTDAVKCWAIFYFILCATFLILLLCIWSLLPHFVAKSATFTREHFNMHRH